MLLRRKQPWRKPNPYLTQQDASAPADGLILLSSLALLFSAIIFLINAHYYHYVGNNYFPVNTLQIGLSVLLILMGCWIQYGKRHQSVKMVWEGFVYFLVMSVIVVLTNTVQYTPFPPVDMNIVAMETSFHIQLPMLIAWTAAHPTFKQLLIIIYSSLEYQMVAIPLLMIALQQFDAVRKYYALLLITALIGFAFYYFYPTTAPASIFKSPFFLDEQYETGLKFNEIHQYKLLSTQAGGMIALPSFHVIWAWLCVAVCRSLKPMFWIMAVFNTLLTMSCVLLGWHYVTDVVGSLLVIGISFAILTTFNSNRI